MMTHPFTRALRTRPGAVAPLILSLLALLLYVVSPVDAARSLVTVYADGEERAISTTVVTVGEALDRAGIEVGPNDLVEPSADTFINETVFRINVYRAKPITIIDGAAQATVFTPYNSPRLIAESAGMTIYPEDGFHFELIDDILAAGTVGQRLVIDRATPVNISLYGEDVVHRTHVSTVGEVLDEAGVVLGTQDSLNVDRNASIKPNMNLTIARNGTEIVKEIESFEHETEFIYDANAFAGTQTVKTPGYNGSRLVTYEVQLENGIEVGRTELSSVTRKDAVTEVVIVGTKVPDGGSNVEIGRELAAARGWTGAEFQCLYALWQKESGWNHLAENPSSGAYGIPQSLPGSKMAARGDDWRSNPATQIQWGLDYIGGRYGTPCGAWDFFLANNWY